MGSAPGPRRGSATGIRGTNGGIVQAVPRSCGDCWARRRRVFPRSVGRRRRLRGRADAWTRRGRCSADEQRAEVGAKHAATKEDPKRHQLCLGAAGRARSRSVGRPRARACQWSTSHKCGTAGCRRQGRPASIHLLTLGLLRQPAERPRSPSRAPSWSYRSPRTRTPRASTSPTPCFRPGAWLSSGTSVRGHSTEAGTRSRRKPGTVDGERPRGEMSHGWSGRI